MMKERRLCMSERNDEWMEKQRNKGRRKKAGETSQQQTRHAGLVDGAVQEEHDPSKGMWDYIGRNGRVNDQQRVN